ncbi:MAG: DUF4921 family protein [Patescibacteria group bacterium]
MINVFTEKKKKLSDASELRHDILRNEWVIISQKRGKRPDDFIESEKQKYDPESDVFANPEKTGQEKDVLIYKDEKDQWTTRVFPNKFPVVSRLKKGEKKEDLSEGPYQSMTGVGNHEVVVTRDGKKIFALLEQNELAEVIDAYRERYVELMNGENIGSISIFHNHGEKAGASIIHPHSQIIALPVTSPAVMREIEKCREYKQKTNENLFDVIAEHELDRGTRVVYVNDKFMVYCPFASSRAYQMRILPRESKPYFERMSETEQMLLADALSKSLKALYNTLDDPDFNYYLRTAPCDGQVYQEYSFHIDVFPRTHVYAGFEFATDMEIVPVSPENAAKQLRNSIK